MRTLLLAAFAAAALGAGLVACDPSCVHDDRADGVYGLETDCAGMGLTRGTIEIGMLVTRTAGIAAVQECEPPPATVHESEMITDAGTADAATTDADEADAGTDAGESADASCRTVEAVVPTQCGPLTAKGANALGLPSGVTVLGDRQFELSGLVNGRQMNCTLDRFGDENILFCRSGAQLSCVAILDR